MPAEKEATAMAVGNQAVRRVATSISEFGSRLTPGALRLHFVFKTPRIQNGEKRKTCNGVPYVRHKFVGLVAGLYCGTHTVPIGLCSYMYSICTVL